MFAAKDLEKHTMVIEYIGQVIRSEVAERYFGKKIIENAGFSCKLRYVKGCGCHYMRVFCMESQPREKPHLGFPQNR